MSLQQHVYDCLGQILDPCSVASVSPMSLLEMGMVREVRISQSGEVDVDLRLSAPSCLMVGVMNKEANRRIGAIDGVTAVRLNPDDGLDWNPDFMAEAAKRRRARRLEEYRSSTPSRG